LARRLFKLGAGRPVARPQRRAASVGARSLAAPSLAFRAKTPCSPRRWRRDLSDRSIRATTSARGRRAAARRRRPKRSPGGRTSPAQRHGQGREATAQPGQACSAREVRDAAHERRESAQPSSSRSFWWRVFVVVPIARVLRAYEQMEGAYGRFVDVPQLPASLSAFLRRQRLIPGPQRRRTCRPGSVQWAFANSGPP
jgi:hypothetical protein